MTGIRIGRDIIGFYWLGEHTSSNELIDNETRIHRVGRSQAGFVKRAENETGV